MCCFFKQKTAYEMRISDWSSDVCSSDLTPGTARAPRISSIVGAWLVPSSLQIVGWMHERRLQTASTSGRVQRIWYMFAVGPPRSLIVPLKPGSRSEEPRVGTQCVSTGRSRGYLYH